MSKRDYYSVLGVDKGADATTIKRAFRKLAKEYHPDQNQGNAEAEKKFKEINEAYEVLKDEQRRAAYDRYGHAAFQSGTGGTAQNHHDFEFHSNFNDFSDIFSGIFSDFMGGTAKSHKKSEAAKGADLRYDIQITLKEAYQGKKANIEYKTTVQCTACNGRGSNTTGRAAHMSCLACGGRGVVRAQQGFFTIETTCRTCSGSGTVIKDPCKVCYGQGRVESKKNIAVTIPAGVEEGTKIRVAGEGEAGVKGGKAGDLFIVVSIKTHKQFKRRNKDLCCEIPVKMTTAVLGGKVEVPCLDGSTAVLTIPPGTQPGSIFRMSGKGMPVMRSSEYGDLYVEIKVQIPTSITDKQRALLRQFITDDGNSAEDTSDGTDTGFFDKVKTLWQDIKND